eukprot:3557315-Prymnesium_polylepis.1
MSLWRRSRIRSRHASGLWKRASACASSVHVAPRSWKGCAAASAALARMCSSDPFDSRAT